MKTKSCACTLCFLHTIYFGNWAVLECWPVIGRLPEARGLWDVMVCWYYWVSIFYKPNHGYVMVCSMMMFVIDVMLLISLPAWSWDVCVWDTWPNHFGVIDQLHLDYFSSCLDGTEVWIYYWWCHVLTWPFWKSSISTILGYFPVICWGPKCIMIYLEILHDCSLRADGILWFIIDKDIAIFINAFSCQ